MNGAHSAIIRTCSWLASRAAGWITGLAVIWAALAPSPAWCQSAVWQPQGATTGSIYYNGGNVGIGTTSPSYKLDVLNTDQWNGIVVRNASNVVGWIGGNSPSGEDGQINLLSGGALKTIIASNGYSFFMGGNVGIGTNQPQYLLSVNGTIGAQDVIVTNTGWSDYVFKPGYRLRPLSEVSQFIQANGHLPDIPTEAEVKEKGVRVGDMQAKLLAKVEELTLHMIQQEKENRELREKFAKENQELRERLARIEKGATADSTSAVVK